MDSEMPIMDGYQATEIIKMNNQSVVIVGMSGHSGEQHYRMCRASGMDGNMQKPINIKEV